MDRWALTGAIVITMVAAVFSAVYLWQAEPVAHPAPLGHPEHPAYHTTAPVLTDAELRAIVDQALGALEIPAPVVNVISTAPSLAEIRGVVAEVVAMVKDNDPRPGPITITTVMDDQGNTWNCATNAVTFNCTPAYYAIPPWLIPR